MFYYYRAAFEILEEFICKMYATRRNGLHTLKSVDEARLQLFINNYGTIEATEQFKKTLLNFDACTLPPCKRELEQHILRAAYIGNLWSNAYTPTPSGLDVTRYGWVHKDGTYTFNWYEGEELPECVADILIANEGK